MGHFWHNDVVGDLQGQFDLVWATVAKYFKDDPWVIGYDPYNEPFSTTTTKASESTFTQNLECFYTGKAHTGYLANGQTPLVCPPNDPNNGVVPTIESIDHKHLIYVEPDIYWVTGGNVPSQLGPMPFPRIVFNFHDYCGDRSPVTGDPIDLLKCLQSEETAASEQDVTRLSMASGDQPTGPAIIMSEFGATNSVPLAGFDVEWAGLSTVSWIYWAWKYYDDPTGSSAEGLVLPNGTYTPIVTRAVAHVPPGSGGRGQRGPLQSVHLRLLHGLHAQRLGPRPDHHQRGRVAALPERLVRRGQGGQGGLAARGHAPAGAEDGHAGRGLRVGDAGRLSLVIVTRGDLVRSGPTADARPEALSRARNDVVQWNSFNSDRGDDTMTTLSDRPNTALLVIDVQNGVIGAAHERAAVVANVAQLVDRARREAVPVVWVQHDDDEMPKGSDEWRIVSELQPDSGEPRVEKNYFDSFEETTLEDVLSDLGVGRLIVVGAQTDACIRSTLHGAIVRGYDATLGERCPHDRRHDEVGLPTTRPGHRLHQLLLEEPLGAGPAGRDRGDGGRRLRCGRLTGQPGSPSRSTMASIAAFSASLSSHPAAAAFAAI